MRVSFFLFLSLLSVQVNGQTIQEFEEKMSILHKSLSDELDDQEKINASAEFEKLLVKSFDLEETFTHEFFSIPKMAKHRPEDESFRMFNWNIPMAAGTHLYRMYVLFPNGKYVKFEDSNPLRHEDELSVLKPNEWYGALYYDLRQVKIKKKKYYVLLGWDGHDELTTKKVLDVLVVDKKENCSLGFPLFEKDETRLSRRVFEYASDAIMNLKWLEPKQMIIFDNLEPTQPNLRGQYAFYGPSTTFGGYQWVGDFWKEEKYVDMSRPKGTESAPQFNFPERPDFNRKRDKVNPLTGK